MKRIIIAVTLSILSTPSFAQIKPCVWPNICAKPSKITQVNTCVWPHVCKKPQLITQIKPCVWPNPCVKSNLG
ncbi:MAG: hypothetical protein HY399_01120 [Elusimicrobia bacterium]|nr:hypothetical protein [Elusimicrobiota bacterium]